MDPVSVIVIALSLGAAAGVKSTAEQAVKDAYAGLKGLIKRKYQHVNLDVLDNNPADEARRRVLADDLAKTDAPTDRDVLGLAQAVIDAVREHAPGLATSAGVKIDDLESASLTLSDIIATGTGVDIRRARVSGDVNISGVRAGQSEEPKDHP